MKVILKQDIKGKGKKGQMIEAAEGYARNFLLPRKLAQEATADNINTMRMNDKATQERQAKERAEALEINLRSDIHNAVGITLDEATTREDLKVAVKAAEGHKCERCWIYSEEIGQDSHYPTLCPRCAKVLEEENFSK